MNRYQNFSQQINWYSHFK